MNCDLTQLGFSNTPFRWLDYGDRGAVFRVKDKTFLSIESNTLQLLKFYIPNSPSHAFNLKLALLSDQQFKDDFSRLIAFGAIEPSLKEDRSHLDTMSVTRCVSPPIKTLILHITHLCNLFCKHCYINARRGARLDAIPEGLETQRIISVLEEFSQMGGLVVDFTGGEPLLRSDIWEILSCAKDRRLWATLLTNGTYMGKELLRACRTLLMKSRSA